MGVLMVVYSEILTTYSESVSSVLSIESYIFNTFLGRILYKFNVF